MPSTIILPRKAHAVVFDMDGLIFDTEALYLDAIKAVADEGGHDISPSMLLATIGLSLEATRTVYVEHCGQGFDFDAFWIIVSKRFRELAETQLRLKTGLTELLDVR
jgi:beta-phosphoglucomutase-like phosphatase (HAD superfamily)